MTPDLRFTGFEDEWEEKRLDTIAQIIGGGTPSTQKSEYWDGEINWFTPAEMEGKRLAYESERKITNAGLSASSAKILPANKTVLFTSRAGIGKMAVLKKDAATNQGFQSLVIKDGNDSYFVLCHKDEIKQKAEEIAGGSTFKEVSGKNLGTVTLYFPSFKEQYQLGRLFSDLDEKIDRQLEKIDFFKTLKQSLLDKMFPQKGSDVPKLRLDGFTEPWEKKTLGDIGYCQSGIGFPEKEQGGKIGIPFFKVSDMNIPGNENRLTVSQNYVTNKQIKRKHWKPIKDLPAIFFAKVGAAVMLNRKRICFSPFLLDNNSMAYCFDKRKLEPNFIKALFEIIDLTQLVQATALPAYNSIDVEGIEILIPTLEEQKSIGKIFKELDETLEKQQQKLSKLETLKTVFLERMFV